MSDADSIGLFALFCIIAICSFMAAIWWAGRGDDDEDDWSD